MDDRGRNLRGILRGKIDSLTNDRVHARDCPAESDQILWTARSASRVCGVAGWSRPATTSTAASLVCQCDRTGCSRGGIERCRPRTTEPWVHGAGTNAIRGVACRVARLCRVSFSRDLHLDGVACWVACKERDRAAPPGGSLDPGLFHCAGTALALRESRRTNETRKRSSRECIIRAALTLIKDEKTESA